MRVVYIVAYDISDPKRWRRVYKTMRGHGDRIQYSVFRCELTEMELVQLQATLHPVLNHDQDQVAFIPIGRPRGRNDRRIRVLGRCSVEPERTAYIV